MTARQRSMYWRNFAAACQSMGLADREREEYRKTVMEEEAGVESMRDLDNAGLDKVLARFAADAGDWETASRFAVGDLRRQIALVEDCAVQVLLLAEDPSNPVSPADYLRGILRQSLISCGGGAGTVESLMLDIPESSVLKVFQMLDTHRRRLLRRYGCKRLAFHMGERRRFNGAFVIPTKSDLKVRVAVRALHCQEAI